MANGRILSRDQEEREGRIPPQNIEAEQGVLGSILMDQSGSVLAAARDILAGPEDFYRTAHQILYRVILELADQGKAIDAVTIAAELERLSLWRAVEDADYLCEVIQNVPHAINGKAYAQIVRQKSVTRGLIEVFDDGLRRACSNEFTAEQLLEYSRVELLRVESMVSNWEEPKIAGPTLPPPFPTDILPPPLEDLILRHAESMPCPPDYVAVPALAVAGAAIGRSLAVRLRSEWIQMANIWSAIVGAPGACKSPALDVALRPVRKINRDNFEEYRLGLEAFKAAKREKAEARKMLGRTLAPDDPDDRPPPPKRISVIDATSESLAPRLRDNPRGLLMIRDELSGWICSFDRYASGGGDRENFLSLWNNGAIMVDRKGQLDGVPIYLAHTFFGVTGAVTPKRLTLFGTNSSGETDGDGFFERFLFSYPPELLPQRTAEVDTTEVDALWSDAIRRLWDRPMIQDGFEDPRPYILGFSPEATEAWNAWEDVHCAEMRSPDFAKHLTGAWSKYRNHAARLALIVDQIRWAYDPESLPYPQSLGLRSVRDGVRLAEYFKAHFRRVLSYLRNDNEDDSDARDILQWCILRGELRFSEREVSDNFKRRFEERQPGALGRALAWLEARHCIRKLPVPSRAGPGRRPSAPYEVNPLLLGKRPQNPFYSEARAAQ